MLNNRYRYWPGEISLIATIALIPLLAWPTTGFAAEATAAMKAVHDFVSAQTRGLSGRVEVEVEKIPATALHDGCSAFAPSLPAGSRLWGKSVVALSCLAPSQWVIYVPVQVRVFGKYLTAQRAIPSGRVITAEDIASAEGNLAELPDGTLTQASQAIGHRSRVGLAAGLPIAEQHIVVPPLIRQGETVKVMARGSGFSASGEGVALANARAGESVRVRMSSGQTISGIARAAGLVELRF